MLVSNVSRCVDEAVNYRAVGTTTRPLTEFCQSRARCRGALPAGNRIPNASAVLVRKIAAPGRRHVEWMRLCGDWLTWSRVLMRTDVAFVAEHLNYFRCMVVRCAIQARVECAEEFCVRIHLFTGSCRGVVPDQRSIEAFGGLANASPGGADQIRIALPLGSKRTSVQNSRFRFCAPCPAVGKSKDCATLNTFKAAPVMLRNTRHTWGRRRT
jgi:hypothetical protein